MNIKLWGKDKTSVIQMYVWICNCGWATSPFMDERPMFTARAMHQTHCKQHVGRDWIITGCRTTTRLTTNY